MKLYIVIGGLIILIVVAQVTWPIQPTPTMVPATATMVPIVTPTPGLGQRTKTSGCVVRGELPDTSCTPGSIFPDVTTAQVCVAGYSASVRSVSQAERDAVFMEYGVVTHSATTFELDHLIALELGGSNDISNLWPEPAPGFHDKDRQENRVHAQVCSGAMTLQRAQEQMASNWLWVVP
jgi:hypothetical protein